MRPSQLPPPRSVFGRPLRQRSTAILVVSLCLVGAAALTAFRGLVVKQRSQLGPGNRFAHGSQGPYKLEELRIFRDVLQQVRDSYVDPSRVRPQRMLLASLDHLQREVAEVIVHVTDDGQRATVRVDAWRQAFDVAGVRSLHALFVRLKDVIGFVGRHLDPASERRAVEYACINGALSTLDPHSVLWDPETYREMKVGTRGSFGGLGIEIMIRGGTLTVVSPIGGTPAARAGIKAGDRIVRIGSESTVNMTLTEAVNRLRGEPGTEVVIYVERQGASEAIRFAITRAIINIRSVHYRVLQGNVGYLRITQFKQETAREMEEALVSLSKAKVVGLVLDLYNNPGGLLDQAVRATDLLIDQGVIVTTVGNAGKQRKESIASSLHLLAGRPIVLLVNHGSASASEILAGALKNLNRAVLIGERTFGKGSVQVLYDNRDGSALKLTIAQYLTPGDVSIQSTGITPDIHAIPVVVKKGRVVYYGQAQGRREQDLAAHLDPYKAKARERSLALVRYLESTRKAPNGDAEEDSGGADPAVIRLGRDLVLKGYGFRRQRVLSLAREFIAGRQTAEAQRIAEALLSQGIDWRVAPASDVPMLEAEVRTDHPDGIYQAGEKVRIKVAVSNLGLGPAYRLRAITEAGGPALGGKEFFFGRIDPGGQRSYETTVVIPVDAHSAIWTLRLRFAEEYGHQPPDQTLRLRIRGRRRAIFAASYQFIDDVRGNRDGLVQRGETVRMRLTVRNVGAGASADTIATLKNLSGPELFLHRGRGRLRLGRLRPGQAHTGEFIFDLKRRGSARAAKLELLIYDNRLQEGVRQRLLLPISRMARTPEELDGWVQVRAERAVITAGADARAAPLGHARVGAAFQLLGRAGGRYRILLGEKQPAFISVADVERLARAPRPSAKPPLPGFEADYQLTPPLIALQRYPLSTAAAEIQVAGTAYDDERLQDVYIEVSNTAAKRHRQKVYYLSNRHSSTPRALAFVARVPLGPGLNTITVTARETNVVRTHRVLVVLREAPGRPLTARLSPKTPKAPKTPKTP